MRRVRRRGGETEPRILQRREDGEFADESIENSPTDCRSLATARSRRRTARALLQLRRSRHAWSVVFGPGTSSLARTTRTAPVPSPTTTMAVPTIVVFEGAAYVTPSQSVDRLHEASPTLLTRLAKGGYGGQLFLPVAKLLQLGNGIIRLRDSAQSLAVWLNDASAIAMMAALDPR